MKSTCSGIIFKNLSLAASSIGFFIPPTIAATGWTDFPPISAHNF
ncbi:MAG: hypothetical protein ACTSR5_08890 [Promethearchaeota archaeon]